MRLVRLGLLLLASFPILADRFVPVIIARHWPMYPDNSQLVTFEGQAIAADRVILSYTRSVLSTAPDGARVVTPVELDTIVKTCDPRGARASITCTHTMTAPFPASSLITYTATAILANGVSSKEVYSFAAGDYPWPRDPIPIRLKGSPTSKLDTVFVPDTDLPMGVFRDHLDDIIDTYFHYAPLLFWRGLHNFYISGMAGTYGPQCTWNGPPNITELRAVADAIVFLHDTEVRNCANIPLISATLGTATIDKKGLVHESAHAWFTVEDEYCCNTRYRNQPCVPNIYCSLADCVADAPNLLYPPSNCIQLSGGGTTKNVWRIDPKGEPDENGLPCIMGPNQNRESSVFDNACLRRLTWRYRKCLAGNCMSTPTCRENPCPE